ncbi:MAG: prolipoprotein diacylglyceryl transferase [Syntrophomonadaceae bacterium]
MYPYLELNLWSNLSIGISSYRLFFWLACMAVLVISYAGIRKGQLPLKKSLFVLTSMALAVPLGARLLHLATNPVIYQQNPARLWSLHLTGFSLMGGLILAALTGIILSRWVHLDPWPLADSVAPGLGIGIVFMRIGCYFNGCCFGKVTNIPWAVHFPVGSIPYKYYLPGLIEKKSLLPLNLISSPGIHPTQIYELLAAIIITIVTVFIIRKKLPSGVAFLVFTVLFASFRWVNSFFRVPAATLCVAEWFYPLLYSTVILLSIILLIFRFKSQRATVDNSGC